MQIPEKESLNGLTPAQWQTVFTTLAQYPERTRHYQTGTIIAVVLEYLALFTELTGVTEPEPAQHTTVEVRTLLRAVHRELVSTYGVRP